MIEVFILSIIQGLSEFIPVSSSSHLFLISNFINFENGSLSIDISLHIGSFLAVITFFRKEIFNFVKNKELFFKVFISSIPVMIVGYFLVKTDLIQDLRKIEVIGWTTVIFGILLFISDKFNFENSIDRNFSYKSAMIIGLFQILSLVPGVSRSGIVITAARFLDFNRVDSAKISFLLSIPTLAAVTAYGFLSHIENQNLTFSIINIYSVILSFIFSFITIKYFLNFLKNFSLKIFVIYRVLLGIVILFFIYS